MTLQGLSGLGDAVFLYPIAAHYATRGSVTIATHFPDVYTRLAGVSFAAYGSVSQKIKYSRVAGSNYYEDYLTTAGIDTEFFYEAPEPSETVKDIIAEARKSRRPVCLVKDPIAAHMHRNKNDLSFAPNAERAQNWINQHARHFYFIAADDPADFRAARLSNIDRRVSLSLRDYLALCGQVDAVATQWGHLLPIAQGLGKPLTVFTPRGPLAGFARNLTLEMLLVREERLRNRAPVYVW